MIASEPQEQSVTLIDADPAAPSGETLMQAAVRLLRAFPRPVHHPQLAGFLSCCRAHPLASAALDYASRKEERAEHAEQRQEREFWGRVRQTLADLQPAPLRVGEVDDRAAGRLATALAQHLVAENVLRLAQAEAGPRAGAPRFGAGQRPAPAERTGGQRD